MLAFFGYLLLVLFPVAAISIIIWDHKRKTAERNAVSAGRLHEILVAPPQPAESGGLAAAATPAAGATPAAAATPAVTATPAAAAIPAAAASAPLAPVVPAPRAEAAASAPLYATRERLLTAPQTLLYYLLRTGLPDHIIFARVTLASVLEAGPGLSGFAREEQIRRLAALTVDFVVSDRNMKPVAVIELATLDPGSAAQADRASARTRLAAAGVRYVELDPAQLRRKDAMRAVVLGDTPAA